MTEAMTEAMTRRLPDGFHITVTADGRTGFISSADIRSGDAFDIVVHAPGRHNACFAKFYWAPAGLTCSDIHVGEEYRRRGIATAVYLEAERRAGAVLHPYVSQYPDGRALWLQPARPFGRGVPSPDGPMEMAPVYITV
jgi:GNAT superfamily N-acetyltransferase